MNEEKNVSTAPETTPYLESVHKYGRIFGLALCVLIVAFPVLVMILFKAVPQWEALLSGLVAILPMYWARR